MSRVDSTIRFFKPGWRPVPAIPPLDGPLTPNEALDAATVRGDVDGAVDTCVLPDGTVVVAVGTRVAALDGARLRTLAELPGRVTCCAPTASGDVLVGVAALGVWSVRPDGAVLPVAEEAEGRRIGSPTALAEGPDGSVVITDGSDTYHEDWVRDLYVRGSSGRLLRVDPGARAVTVLDRGLRYPSGVCYSPAGDALLVSEAWSHTVWRYDATGPGARRAPVAANLPGYPGRLVRRGRGGYWLTAFALRTQLVEFVLSQDRYRRTMMDTIDPDLWVRPALRTLNTGLEPLQAGQMKKLGITKPWAPPRSYGLLLQLDDDATVAASWHSRTGARFHGVTGVADTATGALVLAAGPGLLLEVSE